MKKQKRDWVKIIEEQERSGRSIKEYCGTKGIHPTSFYKNRKRYMQQGLVEISGPLTVEICPLILKTRLYSLAIHSGFDSESLRSVLEVIGKIE